MKARIIVGLALVFTILALPLARNAFSAQELQPGPPPGVAPEAWISLTDRLGFVIQPQGQSGAPGTIGGYFLIKQQGRWLRVEVSPAGARPVLQRM